MASDVKLGVDVQQVNAPLVDYFVADVVEMTDYEPFGMQLANRHYVSVSAYRFGFNGKENDDEWNGSGNMLDFGARVYDSRLGRWLAIDPLARQYPSHSPYSYAVNNPIFNIDHGGEDVFSYLMNWLLEHYGFGSPNDITVTLNNMGVEGDLRKGVAFLAGVAHSSTSMNVLDMAWGLVTECLPYKGGRMIYRIAHDGENVGDVIVSEIPFAGRYLSYKEKISALNNTDDWGDVEWYKAGELLPMFVQDGVVVASLAEMAVNGIKSKTAAKSSASEVASWGACFVAGTPIRTSEGLVPIEKIRVGEYVLSWNESTGEVQNCKVVQIFDRQIGCIVNFFVAGIWIETTEDHPFWVCDRWVTACSL